MRPAAAARHRFPELMSGQLGDDDAVDAHEAAGDSDDADDAHDEHGWMKACYQSESDVR